jgi:MFS family permease
MMPAASAELTEYGDANPWLIAVLVAIATFMEVLDTTIANVALRYIAGGLAVSGDEASWVVTTYLVANSVVLSASGWIAEMFGRKNFFLVCIALFSISSLLCGFAWSLDALLIFRVMQGLAGGGMTPVAQSILAATFPPSKRSQGFALYGVAVVVAPVVGPTLGGWFERQSLLALVLSDQRAGWHHLPDRHLLRPAEFGPKAKGAAKTLGERAGFRFGGFHSGRHVPRRAGSGAGSRPDR